MQQKFSAKNKIYLVLAGWLVFAAIMFSYGFKYFSKQNMVSKGKLSEMYRELNLLEAEKKSFELAQKDLEELGKNPIQPENFFSKDITLVNELRTLEQLGEKLGIKVNISGISGTVKSAPRALTVSEIVIIPYSISAQGTFSQALTLIEYLENLPFITKLTALSVRASGLNGEVGLGLSAQLFLKR